MTSEEYIASLKEINSLVDLDPEPDTKEGERLSKLVSKIVAYEEKMYPLARVLTGV